MKPFYYLFISQPMNGLSDEEILAERERILKKVKEKFQDADIELIDSFFGDEFQENAADAKWPPVYYLGASIQKLAEADIAYFGPGWENARGCKIEHEVAIAYEIPWIVESYENGTIKEHRVTR